MAARASSSSSDDVLSEESDSNALNLYDSDGNNSEPFVESGSRPYPYPYQYEPRRIPRNDPHEDITEPVDSDDNSLGNTDWYLIHCVIYLYLAWKSNTVRVQSKRIQDKFYLTWASVGFLNKIIKGASVELVNQCWQHMRVFVVRKSGKCGKKWRKKGLKPSWVASQNIQVSSQPASMSGYWRPPITRTDSSTAQLITPKTSKLCCFLSDLLHFEIDFLEFFVLSIQ